MKRQEASRAFDPLRALAEILERISEKQKVVPASAQASESGSGEVVPEAAGELA